MTLIPGDGTGPELMKATEVVLAATGVDLEFEYRHAGMAALMQEGARVPERTLESVRRTGVALKGPITNDPLALPPAELTGKTDLAQGYTSATIALRRHLGIFASLRHARLFTAANGDARGPIDVWIVRDVSEDVYNGRELAIDDDAAVLVKKTTRGASERIARAAFEFAQRHGRRRVTAVHRADVLPLTEGIFRDAARAVAAEFPQIEFDELAPDAVALHLVREPQRFDVVLCQFAVGDILSDLCAGLVGGVGLMGGMNLGGEAAIFEAAHGSAPKHAGADRVNPTGLVLSGALMLAHLGHQDASARVIQAVEATIRKGDQVTYDLGGSASTSAMADAIARAVAAGEA